MTTLEQSANALFEAMIGNAGPAATGWIGSFDLPQALATFSPGEGPPGEGEKVLILGAGVAGLTMAYQLGNLGYQCLVLEAGSKAGGRNRTARTGDKLFEFERFDENGKPIGHPVETHECKFDATDDPITGDPKPMYLNLGPGRIPYHHRRVLKYCRELKVALEPYIMETTANLISLDGGKIRWRNGQVANDVRGYLAALLVHELRLTEPYSSQFFDLLRVFGALSDTGLYPGPLSTRSGYELSVEAFPRPSTPLKLADLVKSGFWKKRFYQPVDYLWQPTMFQPVGGMDKIVQAFTARLGEGDLKHKVTIELNAVVTEITLGTDSVEVKYKHDDTAKTEVARCCVSSIPLPILKNLTLNNFSGPFMHAIRAVGFEHTCKVGWQANHRFWEDDPDQIYGGISWTDHNMTQMWYPSNDYFSSRGTLTGAYNFEEDASKLGDLQPDMRLAYARMGAIDLHPKFADESVVPSDKGVSIAWHKVPHQLGGWAAWNPGNKDHMQAYKQLLTPEGDQRFSDDGQLAGPSFYVVGDQVSPLPGWQEGAMMSADYVTLLITSPLITFAMPEEVTVPDSVALTQGMI